MRPPGHIVFRRSQLNKVLRQELSLCIPQPIAFFGDDPSNPRTDALQAGFPVILICFRHKTAHRDSCCPYHDMNDPSVGENESTPIISAVDVCLQALCDVDERRHPETLV